MSILFEFSCRANNEVFDELTHGWEIPCQCGHGENLMIEISHNGKVLDVRNVDTGPGGSLFGMVATGTNAANTKLYFNGENDNNLQVFEH